MLTQAARKPRPADVARWVAVLARPEPSRMRFGGAALRELMAPRKRARSALLSFGLGDDGLPLAKTAPAAPAAPAATGPTHRPETPRDRLVRQARAALRVARHFHDTADERQALAALAALGVDEAGDDVVAAVEVST